MWFIKFSDVSFLLGVKIGKCDFVNVVYIWDNIWDDFDVILYW